MSRIEQKLISNSNNTILHRVFQRIIPLFIIIPGHRYVIQLLPGIYLIIEISIPIIHLFL